jgi:heme/copper-type cytochrome/quinol oxidase subunit 2
MLSANALYRLSNELCGFYHGNKEMQIKTVSPWIKPAAFNQLLGKTKILSIFTAQIQVGPY